VVHDQNNMSDTRTNREIWASLPEEIRELLSSDEIVEKIEAIAAKQGADEMGQGFLVRITANLMKGVIAPPDFVNTIASELELPRDKAAYIAQEVNRDIFSGVKEALKVVHTKGEMEIDPKLVTCLPEQTAPGKIPSGNVAKPAEGSILEQKLGGAFRMQSETTEKREVADPTLVVPPAPQRTVPLSPNASKVDPYRELPS
jgi:hypothetical protein